MALLVESRDLFTGDHVWGSDDGRDLHASRSVCWYSWPEQVRSVDRLLAHRFHRVLPGHGPMYSAPSVDAAHAALSRLSARLHGRAASPGGAAAASG